ncbi:hypothetical protein KM043_009734 [Ampulex compressa]|nr:hypothetical protein KM043_009734 [Ampulex compressa]
MRKFTQAITLFLVFNAATAVFNHPLDDIYTLVNNVIRLNEPVFKLPSEAYLDTKHMIRKEGYVGETHVVKTEDGYLLTMHRIRKDNAPIVFLQHGLICSSANWLDLGKNRSLGMYINSDNINWHECGIYDLPTMLNFVTKYCKRNVEAYIGHSMGNSALFVMASKRPEFLKVINHVYALAPPIYMHHATGLFRLFSPVVLEAAKIWKNTAILEQTSLFTRLVKLFCTPNSVTEEVCTTAIFLVFGFDRKNFNPADLPVLLSHFPAGASFGQLSHYSQITLSGKFREYDYSVQKNKKIYGSTEPPEYNLSSYSIPTQLFYGTEDYLVDVQGVAMLSRTLGNIPMYKIEGYNHQDFLYALSAKKMLYNRLVLSIKNCYKHKKGH